MKRTASAIWNGDLKSGKGTVSTQSGVLQGTQYSFNTRFEDGIGTNPEELIAAAHAGCFTMQLAALLGKAGHPADELSTEAALNFDVSGTPTITRIDLTLSAKVPGIDQAKFDEIAAEAKKVCPVSRVLNAEITLSARLA